MATEWNAEGVLDALPEPAVVIGTDGCVAFANRAALSQLAPGAAGLSDLSGICVAPELLRAYLVRCSGSRSPLIGALDLRGADGATHRFRSYGNLLEPQRPGERARLLLRLVDRGDERFSALARKMQDLNEENRRRRRTQALLEEALRDRELLLRELHHRVKNNIHMLVAMLSVAQREARSPEAGLILAEASRRLAAVGAVHQMLYLGDNLRSVRADEFIAGIGAAIMDGAGVQEGLSMQADPIHIPNDAAVPLALVLNELLANALKHGSRADGVPGRINVGLSGLEGVVEMWVEDEGPGFDPASLPSRRASGLGLVRGLARQLGGSFSVWRGVAGGARCVLRFRDSRDAAAAGGLGA